LTLGQLLRERRKNCFDLFRVPPSETAATLVFGGDVMLGRSCAAKIENGVDPFEGIATVLRRASLAAANLECTISPLGESAKRYAFRAPASSAQLLRSAGFHAMGLANNHHLVESRRVTQGGLKRRCKNFISIFDPSDSSRWPA